MSQLNHDMANVYRPRQRRPGVVIVSLTVIGLGSLAVIGVVAAIMATVQYFVG